MSMPKNTRMCIKWLVASFLTRHGKVKPNMEKQRTVHAYTATQRLAVRSNAVECQFFKNHAAVIKHGWGWWSIDWLAVIRATIFLGYTFASKINESIHNWLVKLVVNTARGSQTKYGNIAYRPGVYHFDCIASQKGQTGWGAGDWNTWCSDKSWPRLMKHRLTYGNNRWNSFLDVCVRIKVKQKRKQKIRDAGLECGAGESSIIWDYFFLQLHAYCLVRNESRNVQNQ